MRAADSAGRTGIARSFFSSGLRRCKGEFERKRLAVSDRAFLFIDDSHGYFTQQLQNFNLKHRDVSSCSRDSSRLTISK